MATHSSILAWNIPWTEDPRRLQSMGLPIVGDDLKRLSTHTHMYKNHFAVRQKVTAL